jgi:uncharacterized protein (DUF849 family)|tara:strand:+ start:316 stop:666 length:351 start_codon:yes stop_codon:yes gene_type:complete
MGISSAIKKVLTNKKLSADITFRSVSAGSYNTTTGVITETNTDTTIKGVLEDINLREVNELIEATDKKIQIAAASLSSTPTTKDKVIVGSVTYSIIRIETNQFANEKLSFVCYLRT